VGCRLAIEQKQSARKRHDTMENLTKALAISFELIRFCEKPTQYRQTMGDAYKAAEDAENCRIDGASPMYIWQHFQDENGTGLRVHMAYPRDENGGVSFGLPVVSQREAIANLIRFYSL
jgi:hypothetical protein